MPGNIVAALETLGQEIIALRKDNEYKDYEIGALKDRNKALCERVEVLESELKAAYELRKPCQEVNRNA